MRKPKRIEQRPAIFQVPAHYVCQSGLRNALPDWLEVALDREAAVQMATDAFGLSEIEQDRLALLGHVYLDVLRDGADYVELYRCECQHIEWHYAAQERRIAHRDMESHVTITVV